VTHEQIRVIRAQEVAAEYGSPCYHDEAVLIDGEWFCVACNPEAV
jgi:hypothetical protein